MCHTVIGDEFSRFVQEQCELRNQEFANNNGLNIQIDPEILRIVQASSAVACQKGTSFNLLKAGSKRRRTKAELLELEKERQTEKLA